MVTTKLSLEDKLLDAFKGNRKISLERALLIASGCTTEEEIALYIKKIDRINEDFKEYEKLYKQWLGPNLEENHYNEMKPEKVFDYLWKKRPNRYQSGKYLFTEVIDAQLSENLDEKVGNCLGLTTLYVVLAERQKIRVQVNYEHWDDGPHINCSINSLLSGETIIENTHADGYKKEWKIIGKPKRNHKKIPSLGLATMIYSQFKLKKKNTSLKIVILNTLIGVMPEYDPFYGYRSSCKFNNGDFDGAKSDIETAIKKACSINKKRQNNPSISEYYLDYSKALYANNEKKKAKENLDKAIKLYSKNAKAYHCRGYLRLENKDYPGAIQDLNKAIKYNKKPDANPFFDRSLAHLHVGNYDSSLLDMQNSINLNPEIATHEFVFNGKTYLGKDLKTIIRKTSAKHPEK